MSEASGLAFEERFAASCRRRRERVRALLREGGLQRAPKTVAETLRMEVHSLAGEAALLRLEAVSEVARRLEELFEREETRAGGAALSRALSWFDTLTELAGGPSGGAHPRAHAQLRALAEEIRSRMGEAGWWLAPPEEARPEAEVRPKVLILDDSEISREVMAEILETRGYPVALAGDLFEFEEQMRDFSPELVLCDLNMPDIQGDDICRTLKSRFETENVPIVLVSSLPEEELAARARAAGADGYVSKHHGPESLVDLLDDLLTQILF